MYRLIRNTHLALGVAFTLMWLMYGVSSVQMSHPEWFDTSPEITRADVVSDAALAATATPDEIASAIARSVRLAGDVDNVSETGDTLAFRVVRPGTVHQVTVSRNSGHAIVVTQTAPVMGMLNRLHHYAGFWRQWAPLDIWGVLAALASLGLLVLGVTGIYLWFRIYGERVVGGIVLATGLTVGLVLIVLLRAAG